jgi:signal transduction histidine kinase
MNVTNRLLFIEDDEIDRRAFKRVIKKNVLPYACIEAQSLAQAHQYLQAQPFDVVICDYVLGDGTALDLIHAYPDQPIIVITGAGDETIAVNAMKAGAKDYLIKDVQGDYLKILPKAIESVLRQQQLEIAEEEQRNLADTLRETAMILNSTLELDEVLRRILVNVKRLIPHDSANVMLIEDGIARVVQHNDLTAEKRAMLATFQFHVRDVAHLDLMYKTHHSCIINDIKNYTGWLRIPPNYEPLSYLAAPIVVDDEVIGFLNLDSFTADHFTAVHADRLLTFVNHAAVAIKNARLYQYARDIAALEERQRLARDLHDSVTQTLFAASVTANAIIKRWQRHNTDIGDDLVELQHLTQGALAEMRTLLLELRPNALLEARLGDLLRQLSETVKGRARMHVTFEAEVHDPLPPDVHIGFFRIAQEALNNVIKHARAKHLKMLLKDNGGGITMEIVDDGRGFDTSLLVSQHFGTKIMAERAAQVGIDLHIISSPGHGTTIQAKWSNSEAPS